MADDPTRNLAGWREFVRDLHDLDLSHLSAAILSEQHMRALQAGDLDAIIEDAIQTSFDHRGVALAPYVHENWLVCPGSIRAKSQASHECRFVVVDDHWVWDHPHVVKDRMEDVGKHSKRSITLLPLLEGAKVTTISSKLSSQGHRRTGAETFALSGGVLLSDVVPAALPAGHR